MSAYHAATAGRDRRRAVPYWAPIRHHFGAIETFRESNAWRGTARRDEVIKRHHEARKAARRAHIVMERTRDVRVTARRGGEPTGKCVVGRRIRRPSR